MHKLVIVESPNKIRAIQKYLGSEYKVLASVGHIVNLSTKGKYGLGIDLDNWELLNEIAADKRKIVSALKKEAESSSFVYIATDPDREGEAIGENLVSFLGIEDKYQRIRYNEITKQAIENAMQIPSLIDNDLVNAQKTRRMLDRIIGFRVSKLMKSKVRNTQKHPSAGRVQSIALKLCVDREKEIQAFKNKKYFYISASLDENYEAFLIYGKNAKDNKWIDPSEVEKIYQALSGNLVVKQIKMREHNDPKAIPFKQSQLYKKSPFSAANTQRLAQKLFEGFGDDGLITYPRTDSTLFSDTFIQNAKEFITQKFGANYFDPKIKGTKGDQNAHEAIRPTNLNLTPQKVQEKYQIEEKALKLYSVIYYNTLKALMTPARRQSTTFTLENHGYEFRHSQSKIIFDGFFKATSLPENDSLVLNLAVNDEVEVLRYNQIAKETQPPARYNDGSLIEKLDSIKVGRPSTFATTVRLIINKEYVMKNNKELIPTELGKVITDKLVHGFPTIINESYTASVEKELDEIAIGKENYKEVLNNFWDNFTSTLELATKELQVVTMPNEYVGEKCPRCQNELIYKSSRYGKFIGCANFPDCKYTRQVERTSRQANKFMDRFKKRPLN